MQGSCVFAGSAGEFSSFIPVGFSLRPVGDGALDFLGTALALFLMRQFNGIRFGFQRDQLTACLVALDSDNLAGFLLLSQFDA